MDSISRQVNDWYVVNSHRWSMLSPKVSMDSVRGCVVINAETDLIFASILFWDKGEAEVSAIHKLLFLDLFLDYRVLGPSDKIDSLLESYFQHVLDVGILPSGATTVRIALFETTADDGQRLLDWLASEFRSTHLEDGNPRPTPRYSEISSGGSSILLTITLASSTVRARFQGGVDIALGVSPADIDKIDVAMKFRDLMTGIAGLLRKEVLLTPDKAGSTREWLRQNALCMVDPQTAEIEYNMPKPWRIGKKE